MKKHLIAAAVAAAVAVPAMAQNVSISGVIDTGIFSNSADGAKSNTSVSTGIRSTPQITLSGTEDLGGGLRAGFTMQADLFSDNGGVGLAANGEGTDAAGFFNRLSFLSLSGGLGQVQIGRTSNIVDTVHNAASNGYNTNLSNLVAGREGKRANSLRYISPNMNGLQADVTFVASENTSTTARDEGERKIYGLTYAPTGPFSLHVAQSDRTAATTGADSKQFTYGGAYDFGIVRVAYVYNSVKSDTVAVTDEKGNSLSFSAPISGASRVVVGFHDVKNRVNGNNKATAMALGVDYNLSKRTVGYFSYQTTDNSGTYTKNNRRVNATPAAGGKASQAGFGIAHSF